MDKVKSIIPHVLVVLGFIIVSVAYFHPVLDGKKIYQSDIVQYTGMAKEQNDFRAEFDAEPYWTNSAFGGMPTYQLGANYPHNYVKQLDRWIRFLPRPADYLFLYFIGFYILLCTLKIDPLKAFFGALAFGFSTYLIIILGVGHNAKAHAIAYMPVVLAGVLMVFRKNYLWGGILTALALSFEISANHFQMTYYLLLLLLVVGGVYVFHLIRSKEYKAIGYSIVTFALAAVLAVGVNATNLMATSEYAKHSTRGISELKLLPDGSPKENSNGLSYDYITEYSYGVAESFNLIAPRLFGGSNREALGVDSNLYKYLIGQGYPKNQVSQILNSAPTYWGDQPIVAAPAYVGATIFFLAILGLFIEKRRIKYALLGGIVLSLLLSWGKNFSLLTDFFIDYVPLYNKFRAVSSIQVLLELCIPVLAVLGLHAFYKADKQQQWEKLKKTALVSGGVILFLFVIQGMFSFSGGSDEYYIKVLGFDFIDALKSDRKAMYTADLIRSFILMTLLFAMLSLYYKDKVSKELGTILVGIVIITDLMLIASHYVSEKDFVPASFVDQPFQMERYDKEILKDTSHYRVFDVEEGLSNARTSYFHKAIGGYHAAKPRRIQQLFDYQVAQNNIEVLNMLNVKYVIQSDDKGNKLPGINPEANGNAWFVSEIQLRATADEEMQALSNLDSKKTAIINNKEFPELKHQANYVVDSLATVNLIKYQPNYLKYKSNNSNKGLAVFSESYYADGWNAYIDGQLTPHIRVNYILRALQVPVGKHVIEFKFEPQVVQTGGAIALGSSILLLLIVLGGIGIEINTKKT